MVVEIGHVSAIFRYPVKSMRGERLDSANLGWHGIKGDRRLALRRMDEADRSGMPWLTATKLPQLLLYSPHREPGAQGELPTHIRTPDGVDMPAFGEELAAEIGRRSGTGLGSDLPDVWVPDSSAWLAVARRSSAGTGRLTRVSASVAVTPVVAAMRRAAAMAAGWPATQPDWRVGASRQPAGLADPSDSTATLAALLATGSNGDPTQAVNALAQAGAASVRPLATRTKGKSMVAASERS